jgi:hypothetical protein
MTYICKHALTDDTISQIITIRENIDEHEERIDDQEGRRSHGQLQITHRTSMV